MKVKNTKEWPMDAFGVEFPVGTEVDVSHLPKWQQDWLLRHGMSDAEAKPEPVEPERLMPTPTDVPTASKPQPVVRRKASRRKSG